MEPRSASAPVLNQSAVLHAAASSTEESESGGTVVGSLQEFFFLEVVLEKTQQGPKLWIYCIALWREALILETHFYCATTELRHDDDGFTGYLASGLFSDFQVELFFSKRFYSVHKVFLAYESTYFQHMIQSQFMVH
jgi:hypothetical protein